MAAKKKSAVNMSLLAAINSGSVTHVSQADGLPLVNNDPPLIEVNTNMLDDNGNAAVRITDAGKAQLPDGNAAKSELATSERPVYSIISNLTLPPRVKRRGGRLAGAPTLYPWEAMEVGGTFFVPVSDKHLDPAKSMNSAVSSANMKYSEEVGEEKPRQRTKRGPGNKAIIGPDGKPEKETVMRKDREPIKKFEVWGKVTAGQDINGWKAPADGVLVERVK